MRSFLLLIFMLFSSVSALADDIPCTNSLGDFLCEFNPRVHIFKYQEGSAIKIEAPLYDFLSAYTDTRGGFHPLRIEFNVVATDSNTRALDYRLRLKFSDHSCQIVGEQNYTPKQNVLLWVDNKEFHNTNVKNTKIDIRGSTPSQHFLDVVFPKWDRLDEAQYCSGRIGVVAEQIL